MLLGVPEVSFRAMTVDDAEEVAALVVRCDALTADWAPRGWTLPEGHAEREIEVWREEFTSADWRSEVGLDGNGSIVGVVGTVGSHVASLFVEPRVHGHGIGAILLRRAEAWLRDAGFRRATLNVLEGSPAMGFYEASGWSRDGRTKLYEPFGMQTIGYSKALG